MIRRLLIPFLLLPFAARPAAGEARRPPVAEETAVERADTAIRVDGVQVTAIKQGLDLRSQPVAASIVGERTLARDRIGAVKELSQRIPNFHAPDY
ncbi:MAG: TonB-dependent receptor, partial [Alistipes sp.]|nr:TonB-dependent receptor [Alistipes sp.]